MDEREMVTDAANAAESVVAPVGRRGGRHRFFRSRAMSSESTSVADAPTTEATVSESAVEAHVEAKAEMATTSEESAPDETGPSVKRRSWFRRKAGQPVATEPAGDETDEQPPTGEVAPQEDSDAAKDSTDDQAVDDAPKRVRKPATRAVAVAVAITAALFVGASALAASMLQPYLADRALANTRMEIARTAATAMTVMWTYSPQDMDTLVERSSQYLAGEVKEMYVRQVDAQLAASKQLQISRNAQVLGAGVESMNGSNATVVVFVNVSYASATSKNI